LLYYAILLIIFAIICVIWGRISFICNAFFFFRRNFATTLRSHCRSTNESADHSRKFSKMSSYHLKNLGSDSIRLNHIAYVNVKSYSSRLLFPINSSSSCYIQICFKSICNILNIPRIIAWYLILFARNEIH